MAASRTLAIAAILALLGLGAVAGQDPERTLFASNFNDPPSFGYDFAEGVQQMDKMDCVGTWDCPAVEWTRYRMDVTNADFDYLGKNLDSLPQGGGKESYSVAFRIRAEQGDGRDSGFAAIFSTEPDFSKGDGKTSGSFRNAVKAKFQESGNDWKLILTEVVDGTEKVLATGTTHGSNEHRLFHLTIDNRAESGPRVELQDYAGTPILPAETSASFKDAVVRSQWFVGYGFGSNDRTTILVADAPSTRIYDTDPQAPVVEAVEFDPNPPAPDEALTVIATITDDWSVERAIVFYRVGTNPSQQVDMAHETGSRWTATVPGQAANTTVTVRIEAHDDQGLVGHSDGEYSYTVGSGGAITKDPNSEKPDPPGGGGIDEPGGLSLRAFGIAFLLALIGVVATALVMREFGKRNGWIVLGTTALVIVIFLVFEANPWNIRGRWMNIVAAVSAVGILGTVWYKLRERGARGAP